MENKEILVALPSNFIKRVEQIINVYNSMGRGLIHGFQKDAIQNSVGARATNSWKGWKCCIDLVNTEKGRFLTVTDYGTEGLTGPNLPVAEIARMCDENEAFPEDWRLARISCNNVSGGLSTGAGLFGVGKTLYSAASKSNICRYYFESFTNGFGYRCNVNDKNKSNNNGAYQAEEGKQYIFSKTGLSPINHIGTRIIICEPKDEIVEAIENGEMMRNIEETWWRILPYLSEPDVGIFLNGEKAKIPEQYLDNNIDSNYSYEDESSALVYPEFNLRTKKVGFFVCKKLDEDLRGFYFYRRGMKIGKFNLNDIVPKSISDRYYGYIEVQPQWENELVHMENLTHYDVESSKKNNKVYSELRHFVATLVSDLLKEWGFIKEKESEDKILHSLLSDIQNDIQELFKEEGFDNLGKGDLKSQYSIRMTSVNYPNPDERMTVYDNDVITFSFNVKSNYSTKRKFIKEIKIVSPNGFSNILSTETIEIDPLGIYNSGQIDVKIDETIAEKYINNNIVITVYPTSGKSVLPKKMIFYYGIETKKNREKDFELIMSNRFMPKTNDKRVNAGQSIYDIKYTCTSNIEIPTKVLLAVSTHNMEDNASLIEKVHREEIVLNGFEAKESKPFDVVFSEDVYSDKLKKGKVDIRARLIVNEDNGIYEKGEVVGEYKFTIFYNMNEKRGIEDSFKIRPIKEPDNPRRSWSEGHTGDWNIFVNVEHPEYLQYENDEHKRMYLEKLVIQEFVILYLKEGKYDQIGFVDDPDGSRTNHVDVLVNLIKKIDEMWYKQCQK
jgi:hypothetical protein